MKNIFAWRYMVGLFIWLALMGVETQAAAILGGACGGVAGIMCGSGLTCRYTVNIGKPDSSGICVNTPKQAIVTSVVGTCGWCGTSCIKMTAYMGACPQIAPAEGKKCVDQGGSCVIINSPVPTLEPTFAATCKNLWWFDNTNKICNQKQFCGSYMYFGLRTFATQEECASALTALVTPTAIVGDADGNGIIDLADFDRWKREYLKVITTTSADFDKLNGVDLVDFTIWKRAYLNFTPPPTN